MVFSLAYFYVGWSFSWFEDITLQLICMKNYLFHCFLKNFPQTVNLPLDFMVFFSFHNLSNKLLFCFCLQDISLNALPLQLRYKSLLLSLEILLSSCEEAWDEIQLGERKTRSAILTFLSLQLQLLRREWGHPSTLLPHPRPLTSQSVHKAEEIRL